MTYQTAERINPWSKDPVFSGWYIDNVVNLNLPNNASPYLRNARLDWTSTRNRKWHSLFSTLATWSYPKGIVSYLRTVSSNDRLIVRHNQDTNKKLVSIDSSWTATAIDTSTDITSDNRMFFQNVWDDLYCMNGVDDFGKLNWTTYTTPSTGIANFSPSFSEVFNGSHFASWWSDNPNIVYKSVADDYEDFNSAWSDTFTFQETITWLRANDQALFYFTNNSISVTWVWDIQEIWWAISYITRPLEVKEWAVNNATIIAVWVNIFYLTPSNKINIIARWSNLDGFESLPLSHRKYEGIDKIMDTLDSDQSSWFAYYLPKENLIKRHLKTIDATFNDICIIYDINKDKFLVDTNKYFYGWIFHKWNNYTISMIEGKVFYDEYWQDDEDSAIPFEYWTKEFYLSDPTFKKILWETRTLLDINELCELTQDIYIDWELQDTKTINKDNLPSTYFVWIGTTSIWEEAVGEEWYPDVTDSDNDMKEIYILRTKGNLNKLWKKFQIRYTSTTVWGKLRLKDVNMKVEIKPEIATDL